MLFTIDAGLKPSPTPGIMPAENAQRNLRETLRRKLVDGHRDLFRLEKDRGGYERFNLNVVSCGVGDGVNGSIESFTDLVRVAYSNHWTVVINPHDVWYTVLTEIAGEVNARPDAFRSLFTRTSEGKQDIVVHTSDPTHLPIPQVIEKLKELVPLNTGLFFPRFTTNTPESDLACMAAFADAVKAYYNYMTMMCGVRAVDVQGTLDDWQRMASHLNELGGVFAHTDKASDTMPTYFAKVGARVAAIIESLRGGDASFYRDIYTQENIGSGGDLEVNGWWASDMFRKSHAGNKLENVPHTISLVPYTNLETGRKFTAAHGCFQARVVDGAISGAYTHAVIEMPVKETK